MELRRVVPPALLLTVLLTALAAPSPAHAAVQCQGLDATIVATPEQQQVTGTEGPDVIVSGGSARIDALGGDDTICLDNGRLLAGAGDDSVLVTGTEYGVSAELGPGDDRYVGGPAGDQVDTYGDQSEGTDTISTGGGDDLVGTGTAGAANHDVVDLGPGNDTALASVAAGSDARISGGGGPYDALSVTYAAGSWTQGLGTGVIASGGVTQTTATGFTRFSTVGGADTHLTLVGTPGDDVVFSSGGYVDVELGAGDDTFELAYTRAGPGGTGRLDAGPGRDTLRAATDRSITADLARGTLALGSVRGAGAFALAGFENLGGVTRKARVTGDAGPNDLSVYGCHVTLRGGDGRDRLTLSADNEDGLKCTPSHARLLGGRGADRLLGRRWDDVLLGGPGRDLADGGGGHDRCSAERIKGRSCA